MTTAHQPELPLTSWTEGTHLVSAKGQRLRRMGSVAEACAILDGCDRQVIYDLVASGQVNGYKRNPQRRNSHLRVDLLSVWTLKQSQLSRRTLSA